MASRSNRRRSRERSEPVPEEPTTAEYVGRLYGHIYDVVRQIPPGRVTTYGQVAELAGIPGAARVVGTAMRASVPEMGLPWQRVVGKRSATSARVSIHDPVGAGIQRALLEDEGVEFSAAGSISLRRFGWVALATPDGRRAATGRKKRRVRHTARK